MKYTMQELKDIYFEAKDRFGYIEDEDIMGYGNIAKKAERVLTGKTKFCRFNICEKDTISAMFTEDDDACIVNDTYDEYVKRYGNHAELVMKMYGVKKVKVQTAETAVTVEQTEVEETAEIETETNETTTVSDIEETAETVKKTERKINMKEYSVRYLSMKTLTSVCENGKTVKYTYEEAVEKAKELNARADVSYCKIYKGRTLIETVEKTVEETAEIETETNETTTVSDIEETAETVKKTERKINMKEYSVRYLSMKTLTSVCENGKTVKYTYEEAVEKAKELNARADVSYCKIYKGRTLIETVEKTVEETADKGGNNND